MKVKEQCIGMSNVLQNITVSSIYSRSICIALSLRKLKWHMKIMVDAEHNPVIKILLIGKAQRLLLCVMMMICKFCCVLPLVSFHMYNLSRNHN